MASTELSLFRVEEDYLAYADTEGLVPPEDEAEFRERLEEALTHRNEKREGVAQFMLWLDEQKGNADKEIERLRKRKERFSNVERRMQRYIIDIIKMVPPDSKGKYRKLESKTALMYLRALPPSVDVIDEESVPEEFKRVNISMPLDLWQRLCEASPELGMTVTLGIEVRHVSVDKELVREAIEDGRDVPGADLRLSGHDHTLIVK